MSTPVSSTTPRGSRGAVKQENSACTPQDLTEQMERMISLQYEQQRMFAQENSSRPTVGGTSSMLPPPAPPIAPTLPLHNGSNEQQEEEGVGQGTLILNHPEDFLFLNTQRRTSSSTTTLTDVAGNQTGVSDSQQPLLVANITSPNDNSMLPPPLGGSSSSSRRVLPSVGTSYGALDMLGATNINKKNSKSHLPPSNDQEHSYYHEQQQDSNEPPMGPYGTNQHQESTKPSFYDQDHHRHIPPPSYIHIIQLFFHCCCIQPITSLLFHSESLHRSFCYGGIDGMLTGAGIGSAFVGLGLVSADDSNSTLLVVVVAFTAAACCADAVCMALGHVWTTHVVATAQATERSQARSNLQQQSAHAKRSLVELLLSKGVLKLDAMSLVDTLEGYPDLFVNAVTGDALLGGTTTTSSGGNLLPWMESPSEIEQEEERLYQESVNNTTDPSTTTTNDDVGFLPIRTHSNNYPSSSSSWRGFLSYGRLTELDMDPDHFSVQTMVAESRKESLCMMLGFSLLSVVPSLLMIWVQSTSIPLAVQQHSSSATMVHPHTLVIFLSCCVMWCLGVWKSRFMDSNQSWLLFGIETVMVLLVCISCAYGLGATLNYLFLPDQYTLQVVTKTSIHSYYHQQQRDSVAYHIP